MVDASDGYEVTISRSVIQGNLADQHGGGVAIDGGTPEQSALVRVVEVDFIENVAEGGDGGGLYLVNTQGAEVRGGLLLHNVAGGNGGGLAQVDSIATTAADLVVRENIAANLGGGISETAPTRDSPPGTPKITVEGAELDENAAANGGGQLYVEVSDVVFAGGVARGGQAGPIPDPVTIDFLVDDPELVAPRDRVLAEAAGPVTVDFLGATASSWRRPAPRSPTERPGRWAPRALSPVPAPHRSRCRAVGATRPEAAPSRAGVVLLPIEAPTPPHNALLDCVHIEGFRYEHPGGAALVVGEGGSWSTETGAPSRICSRR
ncbi:MAG: hypothetical protein M5U28_20280 [Sandaracinaceae bacterium]|nr:hypothetical protein [Sandaracinaceae bacterium]